MVDVIDQDVRNILENHIEYHGENMLSLTCGQLDRALYEKVNDVFVRLNGKWKGGKTQKHVFLYDPKPMVCALLETNELPPKNPHAFFPTPKAVVQDLLPEDLKNRSRIQNELRQYGDNYTLSPIRVLEPSAGVGGIAQEIRFCLTDNDVLDCVELDPLHASYLRNGEFTVYGQDFLSFVPSAPYDYIIMNPPFSVAGDNTAYITHIMHAWSMLREHGTLAAITHPGFVFNAAKKFKAFRDFICTYGIRKYDIPSGAFKESGTTIATVGIMLYKADHCNATWLAQLHIWNDQKLLEQGRQCATVETFTDWVENTVWKSAWDSGDMISLSHIDYTRLFTQLKEY